MTLEEAIKHAEEVAKEPCDDAISRQAVLDLIEHYNSDGLGSVFYGYQEGVKFADAVNKLPSVTPLPKTGHWIKTNINGQHRITCSCCGYTEPEYRSYIRNFCPNCGHRQEAEE